MKLYYQHQTFKKQSQKSLNIYNKTEHQLFFITKDNQKIEIEQNNKTYFQFLPQIFYFTNLHPVDKQNICYNEFQLQTTCIKWLNDYCNFNKINLTIEKHKNENSNGDFAKMKAKKEGVLSGYPDCTIHFGFVDIYVEFKSPIGKLNPNQFYVCYNLVKNHKKKFVYVINSPAQFQAMIEYIMQNYSVIVKSF